MSSSDFFLWNIFWTFFPDKTTCCHIHNIYQLSLKDGYQNDDCSSDVSRYHIQWRYGITHTDPSHQNKKPISRSLSLKSRLLQTFSICACVCVSYHLLCSFHHTSARATSSIMMLRIVNTPCTRYTTLALHIASPIS